MKTYQIKTTESSGDSPQTKGAPIDVPDLPCIVGIDLHPDIFDAVILKQGKKAADAKVVKRYQNMQVQDIVAWAKKHLKPEKHLLLIESTSNAFDVLSKLFALGFCGLVVDSRQTEKIAETFIDNDQLAAERIGRCYLTGFAKAVWIPDEKTRERRDLLHAYQGAVTAHVRATNELKSFLTVRNIRPGNRNLHLPKNREWVEKKLGELSDTQSAVFDSLYENLSHTKGNRDRFYRIIATEMLACKDMLNCMRVLGIGMINAFAIVAIVGDVKRFANAKKLVSYLGLNPGRKTSGKGKDKKKATGGRGRADMRALLIQAAQCVMNQRKNPTKLRAWGFRLFARTGKRNVAVVAVARKLVHSLYHILSGRIIDKHEQRESLRRKLLKISNELKVAGRKALGLPVPRVDFIKHLFNLIGWPEEEQAAPAN